MADKYVNAVGVQTIKTWAEGKFALDDDLDTLAERVEEIISEGGEPNTIETISVNGTNVPPDANKNVALTVPTNTSDLTNDGDGTQGSAFATEDYVDQNGGKIDSISIDGTTQTIDANKNVALDLSDYAKTEDIPTAVSDLTNDSGFQDATAVAAAIATALANSGDAYQTESDVQEAIDDALADITGIDFEVVQTLPQTGEKGIIYLLANSGSGANVYDEYIWIDGDPSGHFEKIGTTEVDLSNYWTSTTGQSNTLEAMTVAEINAILDPTP